MTPDDFAAPQGDTFKFDTIGATIEGTVTYVGDWQTQENKFTGRDEEVCRIAIDVNGDNMLIWPRKGSAMATAIGEAMRNARVQDLKGNVLKLAHHDTKDTGKGNPLKLFRAKVTPGTATAPVDEEPF